MEMAGRGAAPLRVRPSPRHGGEFLLGCGRSPGDCAVGPPGPTIHYEFSSSVPRGSAGAEDTCELGDHRAGKRRLFKCGNGLIGVVRDTAEENLATIPDDVARPWVSMPGLADTPRVDNRRLTDGPDHR